MDLVTMLVLGVMGVVVIAALVLFLGALATRFYRKVDQGQALIINKTGDDNTIVTFSGGFVLPVIHRAEVMDISIKTIDLERRGSEGLICRDNIRADIKVTFFVKVNPQLEEVLKVSRSIGCSRASDQETLEALFVAKFSEALKTVGKRLDFEQLYTQRDDFKDQLIEVIGRDLNGYVLDDAAIDFLEQTPMDKLDPNNILDSQGIRKIVQMTADQNANTNALRQKERMTVSKQNLEADEAVLELGRRRAEAEAKQKREITMVQAKETADSDKFAAQQRQITEVARIEADETINVRKEAQMRQQMVAAKDRERVIAIKTEEVEKDRQLEVIGRERAVELQRIEKEKALEIQRKEIADVVRGRIAVEKTVAEEEERIKDLRVRAEALRHKGVKVVGAEAEAEESLVKTIKEAEAQEKVAEHTARQRITLANADLESADKSARARIRVAEGEQAEHAAKGLAEVKVREADAVALEKTGLAQARVTLEKLQAEAQGEEQKGLARVRVQEAEVGVFERKGTVEVNLSNQRAQAAAGAIEVEGLAQVKVREAQIEADEKNAHVQALTTRERLAAEAQGYELQALAEAKGIRERMSAEAAGITEKTQALQNLHGAAKDHEEFRLQLETLRAIEAQRIEARVRVAEAQGKVMGEAFGKADIRIMGGDGAFFDRFVQAASLGNAVDGLVESSESIKGLVGGYTTGEGDLAADLGRGIAKVVSGLRGAPAANEAKQGD
ncbi:MAG: hypothetical protein IPO67_25355 [Deltaproteobacteria bacterium]|nr:hypothetical protein [Deltaproteobacteria bacterium]MBK9366973.1 hypothetical protein [Deltaproteobacteria bacterium]MBK9648439.1 hypothetical protein [Deltaproteobacteria bacterium]